MLYQLIYILSSYWSYFPNQVWAVIKIKLSSQESPQIFHIFEYMK